LVTLEELERKVNDFIAVSDEKKAENLNKSYEAFKKKYQGIPAGEQPPITVDATETGVDGNKIFKIVDIKGGIKPGNAIDGKKSTYFEGTEITADIGGIGDIRTFALKLNGGPYTFEIKTSLDGTKWYGLTLGSLTSDVKMKNFQYFIIPDAVPARYVKIVSTKTMKISTLQLLAIDPDPAGEPAPGPTPGPIEDPTGLPIPTGFTIVGKVQLQLFKHWGRHETNYASGGSGPSERWDLSALPSALNVLAGYEVNLGVKAGKRGVDNFDLKFRGSNHDDSNGGWYIPSIEWPGKGQIGKEYPHPKTTHLKLQEEANGNVGNMKGDFWVGFLAACFNDAKGVPTVMLWAKPAGKTTNTFADYVYMGKSKDTGNMKPGPVLTEIGMKGSKKQVLQIRMDEVPDAKIRNAFAVEIKSPE
jgi:hypothetical protein